MMIRALAVVACLCPVPLPAQSVDIPIADARVFARQALLAGELPVAMELARKLLEVDPDDRAALIVMAAAAPQVADPETGWRAGARAWRLSRTPVERYEAARLTAAAASSAEHYTLSSIWLRIALTSAPDDAARTQTLQDARTIARRNPWSTTLSFSLVPSSNLNGGAQDDELVVNGDVSGGDLSEDAVALAGWRASIGLRTSYRFHEAPNSRSAVALQYNANRVRITDDVSVPDDALKTNYAEVSFRHDRVLETGTLSLRAAAGTYDYRDLNPFTGTTDDARYDIWRLGLDHQVPVSDTVALAVTAQREWLTYSNTGIGEVDRVIMQGTLSHARPSGDRITASLRLTDSNGDTPNYTSQERLLQGAYSWAEPLGPVSLSVNAGISATDFPEYLLLGPVEGGRRDRAVFYGMTLGFPDYSYAGFSPSLTLSGNHSESNISRFARDTVSVGFTLQSVF